MNKKTSIVLTTVLSLAIIVVVATFAFSYFSGYVDKHRNSNVNVSVSNTYSPVFVAYSEGNLELNVNSTLMDSYYSNNGEPIAVSSQNIVVSLMSGGNSNVTCEYYFVWKNTGDEYVKSPGATKEYTVEIKEDGTGTMLSESNMDRVNAYPDLYRYRRLISSNGTLVEKHYTVTLRYYNLNIIQQTYNKHFSGEVQIVDVACI